MTNKITLIAFFAVSVLLLGTMAGPLNLVSSADALKGQGVSSSKYGAATKGTVCGDKLCSEVTADVAAVTSVAADCMVRGPWADLHGCDLSGADLGIATLYSANLSGAVLSCADLTYANLVQVQLQELNGKPTDLTNTKLQFANLAFANLSGAVLSDADLTDANLESTNLTNVDLSTAKGGSFVGCLGNTLCQ